MWRAIREALLGNQNLILDAARTVKGTKRRLPCWFAPAWFGGETCSSPTRWTARGPAQPSLPRSFAAHVGEQLVRVQDLGLGGGFESKLWAVSPALVFEGGTLCVRAPLGGVATSSPTSARQHGNACRICRIYRTPTKRHTITVLPHPHDSVSFRPLSCSRRQYAGRASLSTPRVRFKEDKETDTLSSPECPSVPAKLVKHSGRTPS